jgi:hypothetical protein
MDLAYRHASGATLSVGVNCKEKRAVASSAGARIDIGNLLIVSRVFRQA